MTDKMKHACLLAVAGMFGLLALGFTAAISQEVSGAEGAVPPRAIRVAAGHLEPGTSWSVLLFGSRKLGSCWVTRSRARGLVSSGTSCGYSVPERSWQLAATGSARNHRKSMLFFLTRRGLGMLRVTIFNGRSTRHVDFEVDHLKKALARDAGLPNNFAFAGHSFRGPVNCIRAIEAFDESGRLVKRAPRRDC